MRPPKQSKQTDAKTPLVYRKEGWLEHLEKEVDPNLREDLELLLRNSNPDRDLFAGLKATRDLVKKSDDVLLPESGLYYENLHDKIMAAIEAEPSKGTNVLRNRATQGFAWRTFAGAASMMMMLAIVSWVTLKAPVGDLRSTAAVEKSADRFDRDLANVAEGSSDVAQELNGYESESEFVTAALEEKLKNLSPGQADALLASLDH